MQLVSVAGCFTAVNRTIHDTLAFVQVRSKLRAVAQSSQGATDGFRLRLFDIILEVLDRLRTISLGNSALAILNRRLEDSELLFRIQLYQARCDLAVRMIVTEP